MAERMLIIDDDARLAAMVSEYLTAAGFVVARADADPHAHGARRGDGPFRRTEDRRRRLFAQAFQPAPAFAPFSVAGASRTWWRTRRCGSVACRSTVLRPRLASTAWSAV
jgi:hypothetical protein